MTNILSVRLPRFFFVGLVAMLMLSARTACAIEAAIFDARNEVWVTEASLIERLAYADVVLLGEDHGNEAHHRIQAHILTALIEAGRSPALCFEMLSEREEAAHDDFRQAARNMSEEDRDAARGQAIRWTERGWPVWPAYAPLFRVADRFDLPIRHADLPPDLMRNIRRYGLLAVPRSLRERLFARRSGETVEAIVNRLAPAVAQAHQLAENDPALIGLAHAQLVRDAYMAFRLLQAGRPSLLIAGIEHVRTDHAVPAHLSALDPNLDVVSIALIEDHSIADAAAYSGGRLAEGEPSYDYIWFEMTDGRH